MPPDDAFPIGRASRAPDTQAPDGSEIRLLATIEHGATRASLCEVTLPAGAISRPVCHQSIEEIWHITAGRGRVLVVEDGEINQIVAMGMLERLGYTVEVADDGVAGVAALARSAYDAVFMDVQMPGMDGYRATGEIRRMEGSTRHTPIIAMTAGAAEGDRDRCLAAGMDDYITKPVEMAAMENALDRWVPVR